ncbi:tetratricopeptide repeat protein [Actinosynnema sp. NPDC051121]
MGRPARLCDSGRSWALLIGNAHHRSDALPDIPAVPNNLRDLKDALTRRGGFAADRCTTLDDFDVRDAGAALADAAENAEDVLFVYFAGHGLLDQRGDLLLAGRDTEPSRSRYTALPFDWIRQAMLDTAATTRVLVLDCCFSGRAIEAMGAADGQIDISGAYTLTSSSATQTSHAPAGARHTGFTGELLRLAGNGVTGGPELITMLEVYRHLSHALPARGLPKPQQRGTAAADSFALFRNAAHGRTAPRRGLSAEDFDDLRERAVRLDDAGRHREAVRLFQELIGSGRFRVEERETLELRRLQAEAVGRAGRLEECLRQLGDLEADTEDALGPDDPAALAVRCALAEFELESGGAQAAVTALEELAPRVRGTALAHRVRHALGRALASAERADDARTLLAELLAAIEESVGPDHLDALAVRASHAATLPPDQAVPALRDLSDRAVRALGPRHPLALAIRHRHATSVAQRAPRRALGLLHPVRADAEQALGADHPTALAVRHSYGALLGRTGDSAGAARELLRVAADRERVLGANHPDSRRTRRDLRRYLDQR